MIKVKDTVDLTVLEKYGFEKVDKSYYDERDEFEISENEYMFNIGHARRGQFYYLLVSSGRNITIYASKPDGDGTNVSAPDVLIDLVSDGIIEKTK